MKILIAVSSKSGNTRKIAEAIHRKLPQSDLFAIEEAPAPDAYDLIFVGFWIDKGTADAKAQRYMQRLDSQKVALFATLGAYPDSDYALESLDNAAALLPESQILDRFICQGAIDPKLVGWMKTLPDEHPHAPDEIRLKRWKDASTHPDDDDCRNAADWAAKVYSLALN